MKQKVKSVSPRIFFIKDINRLEHDPVAQYKFNRFWAAIWFMSMIGLLYPLWPHNIQTFTSLLILEVSLWANFATHFGAMSAALAAMNTSQRVENISDDIDDIAEVADKVEDLLPAGVWNPDEIKA